MLVAGRAFLHGHVKDQYKTELAVDEDGNENENRGIEKQHQHRPGQFASHAL